MIRQDHSRIDPKRRSTIDYKKKQFAIPTYQQHDYPHRLNLYETPPTAEITLEQFEQWAIDRLRSMVIHRTICPVPWLIDPSPCRDRSLLVPQQSPPRDCRAHHPFTPKVAAFTFQHFLFCGRSRSESQAGATKRPLLTLHPSPGLLLNRGSPAAVLAHRECAFQTSLSKR